jgi:fumarate reductase subunit C
MPIAGRSRHHAHGVRRLWWHDGVHWLYYVLAAAAVIVVLNVILLLYVIVASRDSRSEEP